MNFQFLELFRPTIAAAILALFNAASVARAQLPGLAAMKIQYAHDLADVHGQAKAARLELAGSYTNVLNTLKAQAQAAGDSNRVDLILHELDRFGRFRVAAPVAVTNAGGTAAASPLEPVFAKFRRDMRAHETRHALIVLHQSKEHALALKKLVDELTKLGRAADAAHVREAREEMDDSPLLSG